MLKLVLGRLNSGKTTYINNLISSCAEEGGRTILVVPEQFSFETEKGIITLLGEKRAMSVEVCGFLRLAENLVGEKQGIRRLDTAGRVALMSLALEQTADKLSVYGRFSGSTAVISEMLGVSDELKQSAVSAHDLEVAAAALPDGMLKNKLSDLAVITAAYDALCAQSFSDERDLLTVLAESLAQNRQLSGATVFVDGFKGFTAQETDVLQCLVSQCKDVYVTLCTDSVYGDEFDVSAFACVRATARKLIDMAKKCGAAVGYEKPPVYEQAYSSRAIEHLEQNIYAPCVQAYGAPADEITVFSAATAFDECDYVAMSIKKLLRENYYRCRDIAVIYRNDENYSKNLRASLKKYNIPVFEDKRRPLAVYPLIVAVRAVLEIASHGFDTDAVFRLLKSQLVGLSVEQTAQLEEYVYLWKIDGKKWLNEWTGNPSGLGTALSERDEKKLASLNALREKTVGGLQAFCRDFSRSCTAGQMVTALYSYLKAVNVPENLKKLAAALDKSGETDEAVEQGRVWDKLMDIFDQLACTLGDTVITPLRFSELFTLVLTSQDIGVIPGGIDEIVIGSADRIRVNRPKAVFVVGVNDGVFPQKSSQGRVLNDSDRRILADLGLRVAEPTEYAFLEERHIAYNALCCASERLYISYCGVDFGGNECAPSNLIGKVSYCVPGCRYTDISDYSVLDRIESEASAFELAAEYKSSSGVTGATLRACLEKREGFAQRLAAVERASGPEGYSINDTQVAVELFGNDIGTSATKIEDYFSCPFMYFCRHGLKLGEPKNTEINNMLSGTIIHYVLENLVAKHSKKLVEMDDETIRQELKLLLDAFLDEQLGGTQEKDERFIYLYSRLLDSLCVVVHRLINEMRLSDFEPADFELKVGGNDGQIPALEIELADGGRVVLRGKVDRVDVLRTQEQTFVRVMDYKTGTKVFRLSDVLNGLNMQMLLYLFAIKANGGERYGNIVPAGILYVPAKSKGGRIEHSTSHEEVLLTVVKEGRMNGLLLDDDRVVHSTDREHTGTVIAGRSDMRDFLISLEDLSRLEKLVLDNVRDMGLKLHQGRVMPLPAPTGPNSLPCDYCSYAGICLHEEGSAVRDCVSLSHKDSIAYLEREETENA